VTIYGAGIKVRDGKYYVNGGRLFFIVGEGKDVLEARKKAWEEGEWVREAGAAYAEKRKNKQEAA